VSRRRAILAKDPIVPDFVQAGMSGKRSSGWDWQILVFLFVALGMFATASYTIVETYWG